MTKSKTDTITTEGSRLEPKDSSDLRKVKSLLKLLEEYHLDILEVGNIKLVKSKHIIQPAKPIKTADKTNTKEAPLSDEDLLYWSVS